MEKIFSNKKLAYAIIGILLAFQLTQSIANWVGGGFNGGSLILCLLMIGLLTLVGVGISKKNKLLTIVSGVSVLSVLIYISVSELSGKLQLIIDGKLPTAAIAANVFATIGALFLIGSLVLVILKAFKANKNLKTINTIFSIIATIAFFVVLMLTLTGQAISNPEFSVYYKIHSVTRDFFGVFSALLVGCVGYQLDIKE